MKSEQVQDYINTNLSEYVNFMAENRYFIYDSAPQYILKEYRSIKINRILSKL